MSDESSGAEVSVTDRILIQAQSEAEHRLGIVEKRIRTLKQDLAPLETECEQLKHLLKFLTSRKP